MLDKLKRTVKHSAIFALGKIGAKLVGFILLPIYTRELSTAQYGILALLEMADLLGGHVLSLSLQNALFRWYALAQDENKKGNYVFTLAVFLSGVSLLSLLLALPGRAYISQFLFETPEYGAYIIYLLISIILQNLGRIPFTLLRIEEKSLRFAVLVGLQFAVSLALNIYFVAFLKWGIEGVLLAQVLSSGAVLAALLPYSLKRMRFRFEGRELKEMLAYSYPIMFAAIAATVLSLGDRFLLTRLSTLSEVGLYSLGYKFTNILKVFIIDSFLLGLPIIGWQVVRENQQPQRFFSKTLTYFVFFLLWLGLILCAYAKGIIHLFAVDSAYWDAYRVVPFLAVGAVLMGIQRVFFFQLEIPRKTRYIPLIVGGAALLNVALNLVLIPYFDMMGAAYANVLSNLATVLAAYYAVQKFYPVRYELRRMAVLFAVAAALYLLTLPFDHFSLSERMIYKGVVILSFPFVLYFIRFYEPVEIERLRGSAKKWSRKIKWLVKPGS